METASSSTRCDSGISYFLTLLMVRFVGMGTVAAPLPVSYILFSRQYPVDGQSVFGSIIMFAVVGIAAAFIYLAVASIGHFMVRKKPFMTQCRVEVGIFLLFIVVLVIGGVTCALLVSN
jgi:MFS family permease